MAITSLTAPAGADLYRIAARIYGDATAWTLIANANGLADPIIQADTVLTIPSYSSARVQGGVPSSSYAGSVYLA